MFESLFIPLMQLLSERHAILTCISTLNALVTQTWTLLVASLVTSWHTSLKDHIKIIVFDKSTDNKIIM